MAKTNTPGARKSARRAAPGRVRSKTWKRKFARALEKSRKIAAAKSAK